ncbi:MAG TPA: NAD(P)-dependent oxidoreductase [Burkholderiales bacterium]|nr:NAD(P)-dependent oxidoreductase [Burkholderiales bacterium]
MANANSSTHVNSSTIVPSACVGFVGLGKMGYPMVRSLSRAGYRILVHDLDPEAVRRACEATGAIAPGSLKEIGQGCQAVITMLPDGNVVRTAALGRDGSGEGLLAGLASGSVLIDMSSSSPVGTRELGACLAERGVEMIDAPVSGGVRKAEDATLSIMVGGGEGTIARCKPVLEAMGKQIFLTGPLGSGHAMKALNNYVSAAGLVAATEAVLAAGRFGLDQAKVVDMLNASTGMNNSTLNKFHRFILSRTFDSGFSLDLMVKDLKTALEVARSTASPAPFAEACVEAWSEAQAALGPGQDHTAVVRYWEGLAGSELGKK